jgi:hypothetical protein
MKDILGTPHQEAEGEYRYTFEEICIQINTADRSTIDSVSAGLTRVIRSNRFDIWPLSDITLGKTTFASLVEMDDRVFFENSSKFYHFYITKYFGFPGLYWNYAVGVLECPGVFPSGFHWSPDTESREQIPKEMKINWVCVTRLPEAPAFNYYGFL